MIGKARELAAVIAQPIYCLFIGSEIAGQARLLLDYGVDKVFTYDYEELKDFRIMVYTNVFEDFIRKVKPSCVLVGATNVGRSLAPRVAARFRTGLTADCTMLRMNKNTDLVQIRPAFGDNIMAQILTPNSRPQFCTVRYKVFSPADRVASLKGTVEKMVMNKAMMQDPILVMDIIPKKKEIDISEAEMIVAVGRGIKSKEDLTMIESFAELLGAHMACTRPLIENGWFDARHQIGLSGRTVKPKLIVAIGISGSVQFTAGMRNSDCILAINKNRKAPIFDVVNYGFSGDLYEIIPMLIRQIRGEA